MSEAKTEKRLVALVAKAAEEESWAVELCAARALEAPYDLDAQINLVGALHEAGNLKNVLKPYWETWRTDPQAWAKRCVDRLRKDRDHDGWAVAALLGVPAADVASVMAASEYEIVTAQRWDDLRGRHTDVVTYGRPPGLASSIWAPVIQIGHSVKDETVVHVCRMRALAPSRRDWRGEPGRRWGTATTSNEITAKLPSGSWRSVGEQMTVTRESLLP